MSDQYRQGNNPRPGEDRAQEVVIDADEADADIGYFELKLDEFKTYFSGDYLQNRLKNVQAKNSARDDLVRVNTMIKIYEFILGK